MGDEAFGADILQEIMGHISEGICLLNESGEILDINRAGLAIMENTRDACLNLQFGDAFHCENSLERGCGHGGVCRHCPVRKNLEAAIMEDSFSSEFTVRMYSARRNRGVWLRLSVSQIKSPAGKRILIVLTDDTDRKDDERRLGQAQARADEAEEMKQQFLSHKNHEIRTAINGITGMLELMGRETLTEKQQRYWQNAKKSADELVRLIGELFAFRKPTAVPERPEVLRDEDEAEVEALMKYCLHKLEQSEWGDKPEVEG